MTNTPTPFQETWAPRALGLLRIVTGYMFIWHGTAKLFGVPHVAMFDGLQLFSLVGLAGVLELVAFLEAQFGIPVADDELLPENLDSVQRIAAFVTRKQTAAATV